MVKVGINGFGRIGRLAFRVALLKHTQDIEIAAINTSGSMNVAGWAYLANYDSSYGKFSKLVVAEEVLEDPLIGYLKVESHKIPVLAQRDPEKIPWQSSGAEDKK